MTEVYRLTFLQSIRTVRFDFHKTLAVLLEESIGVDIIDAAAFLEDYATVLFQDFRDVDRLKADVSLVVVDHLLDFVLVAGECQVRGNTEILEFIEISEGSFPSAVFALPSGGGRGMLNVEAAARPPETLKK